jgi:hypothetical protein
MSILTYTEYTGKGEARLLVLPELVKIMTDGLRRKLSLPYVVVNAWSQLHGRDLPSSQK